MLTRRTFLEQFGLVGGSALVMSAMRSWDLMAAQAGPRPVLSGRATGTKVIVLGALDVPLTKDDKERFVTFLVSEGYLDSSDRAYRKNSGRGAGDPFMST